MTEWYENRNERHARMMERIVAQNAELKARTIDEGNFFVKTAAVFAECEMPEGEADYVSGSGSKYYYTAEGVVRVSDHWGMYVASCDWYLAGYEKGKTNDFDIHAGFCAWEKFETVTDQREQNEFYFANVA